MEGAGRRVAEGAPRHGPERDLDRAEGLGVTGAGVLGEKQTERAVGDRLRSHSESAVPRVEGFGEAAQRTVHKVAGERGPTEHRYLRLAQGRRVRPRERFRGPPSLPPVLRAPEEERAQPLRGSEAGEAASRQGTRFGSEDEGGGKAGLARAQQAEGEGGRVGEVGPLIAVDEDRHEAALQGLEHRGIGESLAQADAAAVRGSAADHHQERPTVAPRPLEGRIPPDLPGHRVPGVLAQERTRRSDRRRPGEEDHGPSSHQRIVIGVGTPSFPGTDHRGGEVLGPWR